MQIDIDEFKKIEIRAATILLAEKVPNADRLLRLEVDLGEESPRQILSGIAEWYEPSLLVGKQVFVVANLAPRIIRGLESKGMILASGNEKPVLVVPEESVSPGSFVR